MVSSPFQTYKILAVDDTKEESLRLLQQKIIQQRNHRYQLIILEKLDQLFSIYKTLKPDALILALASQTAAAKHLKRLRQTGLDSQHDVIMLILNEYDLKIAPEIIELGVDNFCYRSQLHQELIARIESTLKQKALIKKLMLANTCLKACNQRLQKITITDDLTKLYNMGYLLKRIHQEFTRAKRYNQSLSVIMIDLDNFKQVNEKYDHLVGSKVIGEIGGLIKKSIRSLDIPARFGGDEYIILLPETSSNGAFILANRICSEIKTNEFASPQGLSLKITASLGVATMDPNSSQYYETPEELIRQADRFLYTAKNSGRSQVINSPGVKDARIKKCEEGNSKTALKPNSQDTKGAKAS